MKGVKVIGRIDEQHRLLADVPPEIPPGPVTVVIEREVERDEVGEAWAEAISQDWADELNDPRQDIYTLDDGEPVT